MTCFLAKKIKIKILFFECYLLEYFQMAGSALRRLIAEYKRKNINKNQTESNGLF
jgi:hypothetical protein